MHGNEVGEDLIAVVERCVGVVHLDNRAPGAARLEERDKPERPMPRRDLGLRCAKFVGGGSLCLLPKGLYL